MSWHGVFQIISLLMVAPALQPASAQIDWPDLQLTEIASGVQSPTHITHAGDGSGRLFVTEQAGRIRVLDGTNLLATPFLDITDRVVSYLEQGLLSAAFPPGYSNKHYFYVNYTRRPDGASVVSRFRLSSTNALVAAADAEQVLLTNHQPQVTHNGGQLAFGPDGYLYISRGDGRWNTNAQFPGNLLGKLLRIDVESPSSSYRVPPDNPFLTNRFYRPEIWAMGLRNPWRFSFDRETGDLYIADVGEMEWEEINFQAANSRGGENYGWPYFEATKPLLFFNQEPPPFAPFGFNTDSLVPPATEMHHNRDNRSYATSLTGGFVHRGPNAPGSARLNGIYFCGDFSYGRIFGMKRDAGVWHLEELAHPQFRISTFGEDQVGHIYLADYDQGKIYRLSDSGRAAAPAFSPPGSLVPTDRIQIITRSVGGATHYTTHGGEPGTFDPMVTPGEPIIVTDGMTLKARTFRADRSPSPVASVTYTFAAAAPELTPHGGAVTNGTLLTMRSATEGAEIRYWLADSSGFATDWMVYTQAIAITGDVRVGATAASERFPRALYTESLFRLAWVGTPAFDPPGEAVTNGTRIRITSPTADATIYYTTNGQAPATSSAPYTEPIEISGPLTLTARAYHPHAQPSPMNTVSFRLVTVPAVEVSLGPSGELLTRWLSTSGTAYQFQSSEDLSLWRDTGPALIGTGNHIVTTNSLSPASISRFFRLNVR